MPFQKLAQEDMEHSAILRSHALRVMGTVDKCLARIRTPEKLQTLMHELGERHVNYNARYDFVDVSSLQCGSKYFNCVSGLSKYIYVANNYFCL